MAIKPYVPDIDTIEAEVREAPEPGEDMIMMAIPTPVYKAISDAAAKKNMTVVQVLANAIADIIKEG